MFKSINKLNHVFVNNIVKTKDFSYQLRDNHTVYEPNFKGITYGKHQVKESTDYKGFKSLLKTWEGPNYQCNMCDVLN